MASVYEDAIQLDTKCRVGLGCSSSGRVEFGTFIRRTVSCEKGVYTAGMRMENRYEGSSSYELLADNRWQRVLVAERKTKANTAKAIELAKEWFEAAEPELIERRYFPFKAE